MLKNIYKEIRSLNQTAKNYFDGKLYKISTITNIVLACITAFVLILTVSIQSRTVALQEKIEVLQKEILISQKFFNEIETRPYLDIKIEDVKFEEGKEKVKFTLTYALSNIGRVPARNIIITGPFMKYTLEHERNYDIMPGNSVKLKMLAQTVKPLKELGTYFLLKYEGMTQDKKEYSTFIGGYIRRDKDKGYFDPIAIKMDKEAIQYQMAYSLINEGKSGKDVVWPKMRNALKIH